MIRRTTFADYRMSFPSDNELIAKYCYKGLGFVAYQKCDYKSSLEWHQKSLEILEQSLEGDYSNIANSYNNIGEVHRMNDDLEQAKKSFQTAWMSLKKEFDEENHPRMA